jgi:hypothetical protein
MFDYTLDFKTIDFRQRPELYGIGGADHGLKLAQNITGARRGKT